ncbi:MAG TPA: ABC transporter permease [Gemmatimonadales bacterium]|jgi:simple sugar transport system permease protein|nr:ABC transporter permease [Gemmatimonadales bacterium]
MAILPGTRRGLGDWAASIAAVLAGLTILAVGLSIAGYDAGAALAAMWHGAFGSWYALTSATLVRAIPLITIGLGIALAFRAGALNIGAEGQFYAGAILATWLGLHLQGWPRFPAVVMVLLAGVAGGGLWSLVPAWLKRRYGVLEVISTLMLNFVAEALTSLMVQGPLQEARGVYPQSDSIAEVARLPLIPGTRLHWGFVLSLLLAGLLWFLFQRTLWGFQLRATGANPRAAQVTGRINVGGVAAAALIGSGMLAGLAGSMEVSGVSYALFQSLSPGYGFTAIAVALLARLDPRAIVVTGILFAALETGAAGMQRDAGVPAVVVYVVEAVIILVVLVADAGLRRRAPVPEAAAA